MLFVSSGQLPLFSRSHMGTAKLGFSTAGYGHANPFWKARHTQTRMHRENGSVISAPDLCAYDCAQAWDSRIGTMPPDRREAVSSGHF